MKDSAIVWYNSIGEEYDRFEFESDIMSVNTALVYFAEKGNKGRQPALMQGDTIKIIELEQLDTVNNSKIRGK